MRYIEIRSIDVGKPLFFGWGRNWQVSEFIGRIMWQDVGKRVFRVADNSGGFFLQVENQEQFYRRLAHEKIGLATYCVRVSSDLSDLESHLTIDHHILVDATSEEQAFQKACKYASERCQKVSGVAVVRYMTLQESKQEYIYNKGKSGLREVF